VKTGTVRLGSKPTLWKKYLLGLYELVEWMAN